jgi:hypothetical protein
MTLNDQPDYPRPRPRKRRIRDAFALPSIDGVVLLLAFGVLAVVGGVATFSVGAAVVVLGAFALVAGVLIARLPEAT